MQLLEAGAEKLGSTPNPQQRLRLARRLIKTLPQYNWLARNGYMNPVGEDAYEEHFADLILHPMEHTFTVPEVLDWANGVGLQVLDFLPSLIYDAEVILLDGDLNLKY